MQGDTGAVDPFDFDAYDTCIKSFDMPPTAVKQSTCYLKYITPQPTGYETTGEYCEDFMSIACLNYIYETLTTEDCNDIYLYEYNYIFEGDKLFEKDFAIQCKKRVIDMTEFTTCVAELSDADALNQMNEMQKIYLDSINEGSRYEAATKLDAESLKEYCNQRFVEPNQIHNRLICLVMIGEDVGPQ